MLEFEKFTVACWQKQKHTYKETSESRGNSPPGVLEINFKYYQVNNNIFGNEVW